MVAALGLALAPVAHKPGRRRAVVITSSAVLVTIAWRLVYSAAGYGAHGSGAYLDPLADPLRFLSVLPERAPRLIALHVLPQDPGPFLDPSPTATLVLAVLSIAILAWVSYAAARSDTRVALYCGIVVVSASVVLSAGFPRERLLVTSVAFSSCAVAMAFHALPPRFRRGVVVLVALLSASWQSARMRNHEFRVAESDLGVLSSLDAIPDLERRAVVAINPPTYQDFLTLQRAVARRGGQPRAWLVLATGVEHVDVVGCCSVHMARGESTLVDPGARFYSSAPLAQREIDTLWFDVLVPIAGAIEVHFPESLESQRVLFVEWKDRTPRIRSSWKRTGE